MSFTLTFSQGRPCCKKKTDNGKVACKFNQAKIDAESNSDGVTNGVLSKSIAGVQCPNKPGCTGCKCSKSAATNASNKQKECNSCANAKWWQFWVKKKNCCSTKSSLQDN